jgi:hypothetical protein
MEPKRLNPEPPPENYRILISEAIEAAGSKAHLADALGYTRGAVSQWNERYRESPYLPLTAAVRFIGNRPLMRRLKNIRKKAEE